MPPRRKITQSTVKAVAAELAGLPLGPGRVKLHAEVLEDLMNGIAQLRQLPLKNVEPAFIYRPVDPKARSGK
jgi:hypothetical protein